MTASSAAQVRARPIRGTAWATALAIVFGLVAVVGGRFVAVRAGLDPLAVGLAFGCGLAGLWLVARQGSSDRTAGHGHRSMTPVLIGLLMGAAVGLALAVLPLLASNVAGVTHVTGLGRPAAPFLPWALITLVVAAAEEGILRGVLFDRLERLGGLGAAVLLTTVVFALLHVPLYGWHVVPLDLAVGVVLAGLRVSTRTLVAPIAAHFVADLATWWL
jgi:membrane protease YdiL (CAAX protease family)